MGGMASAHPDLLLALSLAAVADRVTLERWSPNGVASSVEAGGSPAPTAIYSSGALHDVVLAALGHARA